MSMRIDRRSFMVTATIGLGAFAIPGFAQTANVATARGFTHSVASGEPTADSVLLWTRYVPMTEESVRLRAEISETADFTRIVSGGEQITGPWRDYTSKITVAGLKPGVRYYFRFVAPDGSFSPVGRTKTLPVGLAASFKVAVFSCSNMPFGYFNAYAHAAERSDIDLAVHLGDYIYEYQNNVYPSAKDTVDGRLPLPTTEIVQLADYRLRYASYRLDPALQKLHSLVPMIVQWDDHESANDSWEGGAQNHQKNEGDWGARRGAAMQAYREWMPISDEPWKSYDIGTLATLFRTETRILGRTRPPELAPLLFKPDPAKALAEFRDGTWQDPASTMMGLPQEDWLAHAMRKSVTGGTKWQVVGFGTIMGKTQTPLSAESWLGPNAEPRAKAFMQAGIAATKAGLPFNFDAWDGYPAARARFLKSSQSMGANLVVISGDSHNAWAYDLAQDGKAAGVEFAGHSVTSPGFEDALGADPSVVAKALVDTNPELKWCDTSRRGYMAMTITPTTVRNDWIMVDTIKAPSIAASIGHSTTVLRGRNVMR